MPLPSLQHESYEQSTLRVYFGLANSTNMPTKDAVSSAELSIEEEKAVTCQMA